MKNTIIRFLRNILPTTLQNVIAEPYLEKERKKFEQKQEFVNLSYSQEGEDSFLKRFFGDKKEGFFVDIGAHHPKRFSNTYVFYQKGWRGINVDAMPNSMKPFEEIRNEDINLEVGISSEKSDGMNYYIFNDPALNTFSDQVVETFQNHQEYHLVETVKVPIITLETLFEQHLPTNQFIDFMSIDVEGFDLKVLQSNNWEKYRPMILLVESSHFLDMEEHLKSDIALFLNSVQYKLIGKTFKTLFFQSIV